MTTPPLPPRNDGFVLREDASLKAHLAGIRVRDAASPAEGRNVPVYFRLPEQEARARSYPYITIDLLGLARDPTREHRGTYRFHAANEYIAPGRLAGAEAVVDWPVPMLLTYQVTTFARFVQHDRQLITAMLTDRLPERFGALEMVGTAEFATDNSIRRLEVVNGPVNADSPDPADPNKRIFRKAWTVEVSAELYHEEIRNAQLVTGDVVLSVVTIDP